MFGKLKALFSQLETGTGQDPEQVQKAVVFILLEVACADYDIEQSEMQTIREYLQESMSFSMQEAEQYLQRLMDEHNWIHSIQPYTHIINEHYDYSQKTQLLQQCWQIAYADNRLDKYEEHRIRKLSELLYIRHQDFVKTKLKVMNTL